MTDHERTPSRRRAYAKLWIPDQPGAWMMALLPALAGVVVGGADAGRLWLTAAWLLCYCVQFTVARWLRSRFRRRYLPPAATYAALLAVVGAPFLVVHPAVLAWAPTYAVLAGLTFRGAWIRRERSLWSNAASVLAASMMAAVVYTLGRPDPLAPATGFVLAAVFALPQFGSVLFVKTMIRERRSRGFLVASWAWHALLVAAGVIVAWREGPSGTPLAAVAAMLLLRAVALPMIGRRRALRPVVVGMVEMVMSLVVFVYAVMCAPLLAL